MRYSSTFQQQLLQQYGSWALVTGASSGIGKALATHLAEAGFSLILVARRAALLHALKQSLEQQYAASIVVLPADLGTPKGLEAVLEASKDRSVGLLVASAGFGSAGPLVHNDLANERAMLHLNCDTVLQLTHHFGQRFAQQKRGGIILLSSIVAFQGAPFSANYAATKAYVQTLAEGLYHELRPAGVAVLAAAPGPVRSGFEARANMRMGQALTPEQVAVPILHALGRRATVLPGWLSQLLVHSLHLLPRALRVRIMGQIMRGMQAE